MAGCGKNIEVYVERGFGHKQITVKCGNTSPSGYPWLCDKCEVLHRDRDFKAEALANGEQWDENY